MVAVKASKEALWLRGLIETFGRIQFEFIMTVKVLFIFLRITGIRRR